MSTVKKHIIYIGLGKMGQGMVRRLVEHGCHVFAADPSDQARAQLQDIDINLFAHGSEAVQAGIAAGADTVWIMVPQQYVDDALDEIKPYLQRGMTIIDGGNSHYQDAVRRHAELSTQAINFVDVGTSGGPEGARAGSCLMIGGDREVYEQHIELFRTLAAPEAYQYVGPTGAGHYVKMIHNGIEYGMMQSIAEGFAMMHESGEYDLSMQDVSRIYNQESVITSRLIGWLHQAFDQNGDNLAGISGSVGASGEAQWTVDHAKELGLPAQAIEVALDARKHSQTSPSYLGKLVQSMRVMFGGHSGKTDINS